MSLIVCTGCGKTYDRKNENCPFCNKETNKTKYIEKIVLNVKNTRKGSRGLGDSKIINEICEATGMEKTIAKKFLNNMEHPYGKNFVSQADRVRHEQAVRNYENAKVTMSTARCPHCKSTSISYTNKKLSLGRAAVGYGLAGPAGGVLGGLTSKKGYAVCLNCGKKWKI